jgi:outer membrane protein
MASRLTVILTCVLLALHAFPQGTTPNPPEVEAQPAKATIPTGAPSPDPNTVVLPTFEELAKAQEGEPVLPPVTGDSNPAPEPKEVEGDTLGSGIDINKIDLDLLYRLSDQNLPQERIMLSLEEAIQLALKNNQDIIVTSFGPVIARGQIMAARGAFDPIVSGRATYTETVNKASSQVVTFGGITEIQSYTTDYFASIAGKLPWGTEYSIQLPINREESTFNQFVEEFSGQLTLTLSQPLLRGRGRAVNLATIRSAKNTKESAHEQVKLAVMNAISQVIKAYWDLVGANETLKVRQKSLQNAEELLSINQRRLDIGTAAAIEVLQAKAGVATRKSDIVVANTSVSNAEDQLKRILNIQDDGVLSQKRVTPINRPDPDVLGWDQALREWNEKDSVTRAMDFRPEMRMAMLDIENARIESKRSANAMMPQFDVNVSVSQGGRDHKLREVFKGIDDRRDNALIVGAQGSIPILNRSARGSYYSAKQSERQAEQQLARTKQDLILSVRLALRGVQSSRVLVESNSQSKLLQEANLDAENKRLKLGATTSYQVLQVEEDLTLAELSEVQAQINFEKALVDLRLAEGTLLKELSVEYNEPEPEEPVSFIRSIVPHPVE